MLAADTARLWNSPRPLSASSPGPGGKKLLLECLCSVVLAQTPGV